VPLPASLASAISEQLARYKPAALAAATTQTTARYRGGSPSQRAIPDELAIAAYLAARLPATYAAALEALERLKIARPDFVPYSLIDVGAGPGTASFAACEVFDQLADVQLIDAHSGLRAISRVLCNGSEHAALQHAKIEAGNMISDEIGHADLVIAGYTLVELGETKIGAVAQRLFAAATGALVLIEPGTPDGWRRVMLARNAIIAAGGHVLAPCPHDKPCPLVGSDWCHFSIRVQRSRAHKAAKGADVPFEDEKFMYLVAARDGSGKRPSPRIIAQPHVTKPGIRMKLCDTGEVREVLVPARDRLATRRSRHLRWGDVLTVPTDAPEADHPAPEGG
jgi:ribosomal protein RSM22 (predicted rRNA methylase)